MVRSEAISSVCRERARGRVGRSVGWPGGARCSAGHDTWVSQAAFRASKRAAVITTRPPARGSSNYAALAMAAAITAHSFSAAARASSRSPRADCNKSSPRALSSNNSPASKSSPLFFSGVYSERLCEDEIDLAACLTTDFFRGGSAPRTETRLMAVG